MEPDVTLPRLEPLRASAALRGAGEVVTAEIRLRGLPRGAALLLVADGGLDREAPELMNALAEHGYESLAADLTGLDLDDAGRGCAVRGLLDLLEERGWKHEQVGLIGYGDSGTTALLAAGSLTLGAAVSLSPRGTLDRPAPRLRTPWLGMFGELDPATPPDDVVELGRRLADAPAFSRVVVYPGVGPDYYRGAADALGHAAAFDSWQRVVEWLNVRVSPRPSPFAELWALRHQQPTEPSPEGSVR